MKHYVDSFICIPDFLLHNICSTLSEPVNAAYCNCSSLPQKATSHCLRKSQSNSHSVCLHAKLNQIKAIIWLCSSIGQLELSEYTWRWEHPLIGRNMSCPGTIGGAVPISTSGNRATVWPVYVTGNNKPQAAFEKDVFSRQLSVHFGSTSPQNKCFFLLTGLQSLFIHCASPPWQR